jgi:hypothetical protein
LDTTLSPVLDVKLALWVFLGLLPVDFALVFLDALHLQALAGHAPGWLRKDIFGMHLELGLAESFEYLKSAATALAIGMLARRERATILWVLCALNVWMVLDNAFALHERVGQRLARHVLGGLTLGLDRPRDLGELICFGLAGGGFLGLLALTWRSASPLARQTTLVLSIAVAGAAFFGVGVDAIHSSPWATGLDELMAEVEDGGESLMISLGCALAFGCLGAAGVTARPVNTRLAAS